MSRMRRNVSPSTTKQGPIKAVIAFSLKNNTCAATSRSSNSSPRASDRLWNSRKSPDHRSSPERRSPNSPSQKEKSGKSQRHSPVQYLCPSAWRASSADPLVPSYLTGQWPKDINSYHHYHSGGVFMCDKSTQTVTDDWIQVREKKKSKGHRRSASFGHGDLSKEVIKQRLQKSKDSGRQRLSRVPGIHCALSLTAPPAVFAQIKTIISASSSHIPVRQNMNRFQRNSVEGLNVEIEKLVLSKPGSTYTSGQEPPEPEILRAQDIPDGHRAPIPEVTALSCTRSVDTQTPSSAQAEEAPPPSAVIGRPESVSPAVGGAQAAAVAAPSSHTTDFLRPECRSDSLESKSSKGDSEFGSPEPSKFVSSPKPEKSCPFVRQPPDGCEKIKVIEESRPSIKEPLLFCPVKPNQFVFKPSQGSAFCPLIKHYLGEADLSLRPVSAPLSVAMPPVSALNQSPTIEGQ